jgi:NTP pyrophosphatase (non-canonical NTP hydrolase)
MIDPEEINFATWRVAAEEVHQHCMERMSIRRGSVTERNFLALAAAGEAGEVANVQKKIWRDGESEELTRKLEDEIADVLIYLEHLRVSLRIDFDFICARKMREVVQRPFAARTRSYQELAPEAGSAPSAGDQSPHSTQSDRPSQSSGRASVLALARHYLRRVRQERKSSWME